MKFDFSKYFVLVAILATGNSDAAENRIKSDVKEIKAPDMKSLWATDKLISDIGISIDTQEVQEFIKDAVAGCTDETFDRDPLKCHILDNLMSVTTVYNYIIISAEWFSGQCGGAGLCATMIFDTSKKRIVYNGDTYGVTALNGKLYAINNNGKTTTIKLLK